MKIYLICEVRSGEIYKKAFATETIALATLNHLNQNRDGGKFFMLKSIELV